MITSFAGQFVENVSVVDWFSRLANNNTMDTYFALLVTGIAYPVMILLCVAVLVLHYKRNGMPWYSVALPWSLHWRIFVIGFFNATNGVFTLAASPNTRTPPFIQQGLFTLGPFFTALMNMFWLKESMGHYNNKWGYLCLLCMVISFGLALAPPIQDAINGDDSGHNVVFWSTMFTLGSVFACVYNVGQKWWLHHAHDSEMRGELAPAPETFKYYRMLFWQTLYSGTWIVLLMPVDIIPGFGDSSTLSEFKAHASNVLSSGLLPWMWSKYSNAGLLGLAFNVGYIVSLIASLRLNHESVVFCALANVAVSWGAQVFFYLIPSLQGPVDLPWWSIWLPLVFGGIGVVGFAVLEDRGGQSRKTSQQSLLPINTETTPLIKVASMSLN